MSNPDGADRLTPEKPRPTEAQLTELTRRRISAEEIEADLLASRRFPLDPSSVSSVCLVLGPYRNLTTLTAAIMALHPGCQVLNHAGIRMPPETRFLEDDSDGTLDAFIRYAVYISQKGGSLGSEGGSIRGSHAFLREPVRSLYAERFGDTDLKERIGCVFWKESMFVTRVLRSPQVDLPRLLDREPRLRFLLPIRNPLDCARSNMNVGGGRFLTDTPDPSTEDLVDAVLDSIAWFLAWERERPDRFLSFWQGDVDADVLRGIAELLALEPEGRWVSEALRALRLSPGYDHTLELVAHYRTAVERIFHDLPEPRDNLLRFAEPSADAT